ncbi:MAG: hypothetical protein HFJ38_04850 [Bacilli bacterium]|nr:hypothetical protein [Bacilli bacterium]
MDSLKSWLDDHNINKSDDLRELKNIFYNMDLQMRNLHSKNYFITSFSIDSIFIDMGGVSFRFFGLMDSDDKEHYINQNIYYLACLEFAIYCDCLNYINPDNREYLKNNFNDFSLFLPDDVSSYYEGVFVKDLYIYLSDFIHAKINRDRGIDYYNDSNSSNVGKGTSLTKSTLAGKLMSDNDNKSAAFVRIFLFPFILLFLSILIPLMIIISR